jgi:hypothetical protein
VKQENNGAVPFSKCLFLEKIQSPEISAQLRKKFIFTYQRIQSNKMSPVDIPSMENIATKKIRLTSELFSLKASETIDVNNAHLSFPFCPFTRQTSLYIKMCTFQLVKYQHFCKSILYPSKIFANVS